MRVHSAPRLMRLLLSTMSMSRTEAKVKAKLVRPRRVMRRLKRRLNCPLSSPINDSFSTLYFGVLSISSATVRFRKSYLCFGGNISVLFFFSHSSQNETIFSYWSMNIYLLFFILWKRKYFNHTNTCTHRLLLCSTTLALLDGGTFFYFSLKTTYVFSDTIFLQGVAS